MVMRGYHFKKAADSWKSIPVSTKEINSFPLLVLGNKSSQAEIISSSVEIIN